MRFSYSPIHMYKAYVVMSSFLPLLINYIMYVFIFFMSKYNKVLTLKPMHLKQTLLLNCFLSLAAIS